MGWYYDFYKVYKTKKEDAELWNGKSVDELPDYLQFFCKEYDNSDNQNQVEEIQKYLLPVTMTIEDIEYHGYLATLYPVALFTREVFEVAYKISRPCWYHFVKLTNSKAKEMLKFAINVKLGFNYLPESVDKEDYRKGILGKDNQYKKYPGKLRNIVFYHHQ